MIFNKICELKTLNTVEDNLFLTFDIDWCSDEVLKYTLDILKKYNNVKATFFITHETKLLDVMEKSINFELGIHPNFNPLLNGDFTYGRSMEEVLQYYKNIVPNAISIRSHSMTQNSLILSLFAQYGFRYDCNHYIPKNSGVKLNFWQFLDTSLTKVPYFWEDDFHCIYKDSWDVNEYINHEGLKVFDFHPIHIFLNTENLNRYNKAKPYLQNYKKLKEFVNNESYGTRDFLIDLIKEVNNENSNNR